VFDAEQSVNLIMCAHDSMPAVEIIYPGSRPGPVDKLVNCFSSGIVYHACYITYSVEASVAAIRQAGLRVIPVSNAKSVVLFGGKLVSFHVISGVGACRDDRDCRPLTDCGKTLEQVTRCPRSTTAVIPAKAGIQPHQGLMMDSDSPLSLRPE
jgi:hypothetical protein